MSVWFAIPSKRPIPEAQACIDKWIAKGYYVLVQRDPGDGELQNAITITRPYQGYSEAVNHLCKCILDVDPKATWIVTGGDDTDPDPNHTAEQIAQECTEHFHGTLGVMQPTGDRWAYGNGRVVIEGICGSPWMGRELCRRLNRGVGPMWPPYWHMYNDEELWEVASMLGILWARQDVIHDHHHWTKLGTPMPQFLATANSPQFWSRMQGIFLRRKAQGFPGHELLEL